MGGLDHPHHAGPLILPNELWTLRCPFLFAQTKGRLRIARPAFVMNSEPKRDLRSNLALSGFGNFGCEVFFFDNDAFANFQTDKAGDGCACFLRGRFNGQIRVHNELLVQQG